MGCATCSAQLAPQAGLCAPHKCSACRHARCAKRGGIRMQRSPPGASPPGASPAACIAPRRPGQTRLRAPKPAPRVHRESVPPPKPLWTVEKVGRSQAAAVGAQAPRASHHQPAMRPARRSAGRRGARSARRLLQSQCGTVVGLL